MPHREKFTGVAVSNEGTSIYFVEAMTYVDARGEVATWEPHAIDIIIFQGFIEPPSSQPRAIYYI